MPEAQTQISIRLPVDLLDEFDDWREAHPMQPTRVQAIRQAVRELLQRERTATITHNGKVS